MERAMDSTHKRELDQTIVTSIGSVQNDSERILTSKRFAISEELMGLLQFLLDEILEGSEVSAQSLRVALLDQHDRFHPRFDPIARVQTRRVRNRLKRYYQTTGIDDPIRIELPPKTYVPLIRWRESKQTCAPVRCEVPFSIGLRQVCSLSSDPEDRLFCECLKQELLNTLRDEAALRLVEISRIDRKLPASEVSGKLQLDAVLDSKLRRTSSRLRLSARLLSASDGAVVSANMYDCYLENLAAAREPVARAIARRWKTDLLEAAHAGRELQRRLA
jgi:TolB-like protein